MRVSTVGHWGLTSACLLSLPAPSSNLASGVRKSCSTARLSGMTQTSRWVAKLWWKPFSPHARTTINSLPRSDTNTKNCNSKALLVSPEEIQSVVHVVWHHCAWNTHCHSKAAINGVWRLPYEAGSNAYLGVPSSESIYIKPTRSVNTLHN